MYESFILAQFFFCAFCVPVQLKVKNSVCSIIIAVPFITVKSIFSYFM